MKPTNNFEEITEEEYLRASEKIKNKIFNTISSGELIQGRECEGGVCPIR